MPYRFKLLIIEDSKDDYRRIESALEPMTEIRHVYHADWESARDDFRSERFDLVIADTLVFAKPSEDNRDGAGGYGRTFQRRQLRDRYCLCKSVNDRFFDRCEYKIYKRTDL